MNPHDRFLYLTFDDGPVPGPTEFVLEELSRRTLRATFFCIGDNIGKYPAILSRILADGHTVGNHTFHHLDGWRTRNERYLADVKDFEDAAARGGGGANSLLFRPPYGRITRHQIRSLRRYRIVMWDVLSMDYNKRVSPETCLRRTIAACRPGSIIVFHDSYKAEKNMTYTLPRLIDHMSSMGYSFKGIESEGKG